MQIDDMPEIQDLNTAITKMALSPVKADREAIRRIENESGLSALEIADRITDLAIQEEALPSIPHPLTTPKYIVLRGISGGAVAGAICIIFNPIELLGAIILGGIAASTHAIANSK